MPLPSWDSPRRIPLDSLNSMFLPNGAHISGPICPDSCLCAEDAAKRPSVPHICFTISGSTTAWASPLVFHSPTCFLFDPRVPSNGRSQRTALHLESLDLLLASSHQDTLPASGFHIHVRVRSLCRMLGPSPMILDPSVAFSTPKGYNCRCRVPSIVTCLGFGCRPFVFSTTLWVALFPVQLAWPPWLLTLPKGSMKSIP